MNLIKLPDGRKVTPEYGIGAILRVLQRWKASQPEVPILEVDIARASLDNWEAVLSSVLKTLNSRQEETLTING